MNLFLKALNGTRVHPLTDRHISGLSHEQQVVALSSSGARIIQLREKELEGREFYAEVAAAISSARQQGVGIIVNDRVDIALALKADGVHLGQDDLPPEEARQIFGKSIIGFSTHNIQQAIEAVRLPIDYIAVGPVFATKTKENHDKIIGLKGVKK